MLGDGIGGRLAVPLQHPNLLRMRSFAGEGVQPPPIAHVGHEGPLMSAPGR
jgi:hypothetical protein